MNVGIRLYFFVGKIQYYLKKQKLKTTKLFHLKNIKNITISNTELRGFAWGDGVGWIVMNCADTTSGCSGTNGNFKVTNTFKWSVSFGGAYQYKADILNFQLSTGTKIML